MNRSILQVILVLLFSLREESSAEDEETVYNPKNLCVRLTTNSTAVIQWIEPVTLRTEIMGYTIYYTKYPEIPLVYWQTLTTGNNPLATVANIELGQIYTFRIRVDTLGVDGAGPLSEPYNFKMLNRTRSCYDHPKTTTIKSLNVLRAAATSYDTVEVWWNFQYDPHYVTGFKVFYGANDSQKWHNLTVGLTQSAELRGLNQSAVYRVALAAITVTGLEFYSQETTVRVQPEEVPMDFRAVEVTPNSVGLYWAAPARLKPLQYKIAYDAFKEYINASGNKQQYPLEKVEVSVDARQTSYVLRHLVPHTNYRVNISAIPVDYSYRPSAKITARTGVAAPPPLDRPDLFGTVNGGSNVQILLPKASEEFGPVSHYYVVVVPQVGSNADLAASSVYSTEELIQGEWGEEEEGHGNAPYIAAKFSPKIPYAFILGNGENGGLFKNRRLEKGVKYRVFVRAVVVTDLDDLFTDSPYSEGFSTDAAWARSKTKPELNS